MQKCIHQTLSQPAWDFPMKPISLLDKTETVQPKSAYTNTFHFTNFYPTEFVPVIIKNSDLYCFMMDKPFWPFAQVALFKQSGLTEATFFSNAHLFLNLN